jgi:putative PIN family toxin of toxin-antitoxin system
LQSKKHAHIDLNEHALFIIDTNVVVAGLITNKSASPTARVLDAMLEGDLLYLLSAELLSEYRSVLLRPGLVRLHGLNESEIDQLLTEITANAIWREPESNPHHASPDPQDAHLWALLASEPTAVLITGDQLLIKNPMPQSSVISPATWAGSF